MCIRDRVEKGITEKQYGASRLDVIIGCIFTDVVAWFIVVACAATLFVAGHHDLKDGAEAAASLRPLAGKYAYILFSVGLFNASLFAASILPISTAYAVCEGLGFESGLDKKFSEAPFFYWLYTGPVSYTHLDVYKRQPFCAALVWFMVVKGSYQIVEKAVSYTHLGGSSAGCASREAGRTDGQ